jgi:hypothetical protein
MRNKDNSKKLKNRDKYNWNKRELEEKKKHKLDRIKWNKKI